MNSKAHSQFIESLKNRLREALPGEAAQYRMAPSYRPRMTQEQIMQQNPRIGGVLILVYEKEGEWHTVFTQRKQYQGVHSGQMSFPGGKKDEWDKDIVATALREAVEEISINVKEVEVIGRLTELYIPPSNFLVYPVIAHLLKKQDFMPEEREVEKIVEIPLSFFLDDSNIKQTTIEVPQGIRFEVPAFIFNDHVIWGATAIMLSEFRELVAESITT